MKRATIVLLFALTACGSSSTASSQTPAASSLLLHANDLVIFDGHQQVARHDLLPGRLEAHLELDHYLEALIRKPGALPGATALEQARAAAGTRVNNLRREHT